MKIAHNFQAGIKRTFASLKVRNYRLYFFGQGVSMSGTWMQTIAVSWLVLQLTHSGTQLGLVLAAQFLPTLLFGVWGGVIADRFSKRHVLYCTQTLAGLIALLLGLLVVTHHIQLWMVYTLVTALGVVSVFDNPSRQSFVVELVGPDRLRNAVTLNSMMVNMARVVGPSIAGVLIATVGIGQCFLINAASYAAVLIALAAMRQAEFTVSPRTPRAAGQIKAGLLYVLSEPPLRATILMMFIVGTFAFEFPVIFPLFATVSLHGNASTYSAITAASALGAIVGGLYSAGRGVLGPQTLMRICLLFGVSMLLVAVAPNLMTALLLLVIMGGLSVLVISLGNTTLQLNSRATMRGRVMSLWSIAYFGTTPIGGPIIGVIADHSNPRIGLAVGGVSAMVAAGLGLVVSRPLGRHT